mgnify:FL=1
MNAFEAANASDSIDFRDAVPNVLVKAGGYFFGATGFFVAGSGLQLLIFADWQWMWLATAATLMTLGTVGILVAAFVIKGRSWAAVFGVPLSALTAVVTVAWAAYMLLSLAISPLTLLAALLACVSAMLVPFTVPGSLKATRARNALYA